MKPSEFGGKAQPNGIQPSDPDVRTPSGAPAKGGHKATASERLRQVYRAGTEDGDAPPDPAAFEGWTSRE